MNPMQVINSEPLVSAIIPTYNRADIVCEAIASVLAQTYRNIEIIVVDDGSTDGTKQALTRYEGKVRVVVQANGGPSAARNRGVAVSRGELVGFLDSDDLWMPSKIERQVALLAEAGPLVPCCLCNIMMCWRDGERASFDIANLWPPVGQGIWVNVEEVLATRFVLFNQGILIRRGVLERLGGFNENLRLMEDAELSLRLACEGPWGFIREPLVVWRESADSCYQDARKDERSVAEPLAQILEAHLARVPREDRYTGVRRHLAREFHRARRQLRAAEMIQGSSRAIASAGKCLRAVERCRRALFLRSPWFPRMRVASVEPQNPA